MLQHPLTCGTAPSAGDDQSCSGSALVMQELYCHPASCCRHWLSLVRLSVCLSAVAESSPAPTTSNLYPCVSTIWNVAPHPHELLWGRKQARAHTHTTRFYIVILATPAGTGHLSCRLARHPPHVPTSSCSPFTSTDLGSQTQPGSEALTGRLAAVLLFSVDWQLLFCTVQSEA